MHILESEHDDVQQHLRLDEPSKIDSDSSDEKGLAIDEDIINDDADTNIIEQTQVNDFLPQRNYFRLNGSIWISFRLKHDVANILNSQNALAAAAAAAAAVAANSASNDRLTPPDMQDARLKLSSAAVAHINGTSEYIYRSKASYQLIKPFQSKTQ